MNPIKMILLVSFSVAAVSGCSVLGSERPAAGMEGNEEPAVAIDGTIVFASPHKGGQYADIYLLDAQGTHWLTGAANTAQANPVWSPDGTQVAYITDKWQLAIFKRDGSGGAYLTPEIDDPSLLPYRPAWLPDGNISFEVPGQLAILRPDGSGVRVLRPDRFSANHGLPAYAWSPDGSQVVYDCSGFQEFSVCLFDLESGESRTLLEPPGPFQSLAWSPDGKTILGAVGYTADLGTLEVEEDLYVFNADGQDLHALAQPGEQANPAWSPDGKQIVYEFRTKDAEGSSFGLGLMNADGSGSQQLVGAVGFRGPEMDDETIGLFGRLPDWITP